MKKYPKRDNKIYREIDMFNVHKCDFSCMVNIYQTGDIVHFNVNELVDGLCEKNETITRGMIKLDSFEKDNPETTMGELLHDDEIILTKGFNVYICFPVNNKCIFKIDAEKNTTLGELLDTIKRIYQQIYDEEYNTCTPIRYTLVENCSDCNILSIQHDINNKEKIEGQECVICLHDDKDAIKLDCGHILHNECLSQWVALNNNTCPICREYINKCNSCNGKLQIEKEYENKVIPIEHRRGICRNTTDGTFGVYGLDFENLYLNRIFYSNVGNKLYLKF